MSIEKILIQKNIVRNKQQASYMMIGIIIICIFIIFIINRPNRNNNNDLSLDPQEIELINLGNINEDTNDEKNTTTRDSFQLTDTSKDSALNGSGFIDF